MKVKKGKERSGKFRKGQEGRKEGSVVRKSVKVI
jgi:hypothetical protein